MHAAWLRMRSDLSRDLGRLFMLADCHNCSVYCCLENGLVAQVLDDLIRRIGVKDHTDDTTSTCLVVGHYSGIKTLAQVLLLGIGSAKHCEHFSRYFNLLHRLSHNNWHGHLRGDLMGCASSKGWKGWEGWLINSYALLGRILLEVLLLSVLVSVLMLECSL